MTTDKIIAAAHEAEAYATSQTNDIVDWKAIAQERFYAIAYRAGMERAAEIAVQIDMEIHGVLPIRAALIAHHIQDAILAEAHAKNQPESTHDTGNV